MKKISYYTFIICTLAILTVSVFCINKEMAKKTKSVDNNLSEFLQTNILHSVALTKELKIEYSEKIEEIKGTNQKDLENKESKIEENKPVENKKPEVSITPKKEDNQPIQNIDDYNAIDTTNNNVLETYQAAISYYGPDCNGCSGRTASGYQISRNKTTYYDSTYGNIRIVAGDYKYPFGTIIRFTYQTGQSELAILLDRGGVGIGKKYQFDLLVSSEAESYKRGVSLNTKVEILRTGY